MHVARRRLLILILGSLLTSISVALAGLIAFIGLLVPHIARMLFGANHRLLLPASMLLGAIFLTVADILARMVLAPQELPVGLVTALVGAPWVSRSVGGGKRRNMASSGGLGAPPLEARGLACGYGDRAVVQGVDISLAPGQMMALLGRNVGSGKSHLAPVSGGSIGASGGRGTSGRRTVGPGGTADPGQAAGRGIPGIADAVPLLGPRGGRNGSGALCPVPGRPLAGGSSRAWISAVAATDLDSLRIDTFETGVPGRFL